MNLLVTMVWSKTETDVLKELRSEYESVSVVVSIIVQKGQMDVLRNETFDRPISARTSSQ